MKGNRKGIVYFDDIPAGIIEEFDNGYRFIYQEEYKKTGIPISVNLPFEKDVFESEKLFVFFKSLLPEGWYREIIGKTLKIDENDNFGFLIKTCQDTIGAVSIKEIRDE